MERLGRKVKILQGQRPRRLGWRREGLNSRTYVIDVVARGAFFRTNHFSIFVPIVPSLRPARRPVARASTDFVSPEMECKSGLLGK